MKTRNFTGVALVALATSTMVSCDILKDLEYTVEPNPVEMHGDSVTITAHAIVPEKGLHKKAVAEITPILKWDGGEKAFAVKTIKGPDAAGNGEVVPKAGKKVTYTGTVPYMPEMEVSQLHIHIKATKGNKVDEVTSDPIAPGVDITPYLLMGDDKAILGADQFQRVTMETQYAVVNYSKNNSNVRSGEYKDADYKAMQAFIKESAANPKVVPKTMDISAYASPEGELTLNNGLADERAASASKAIDKDFQKHTVAVTYNNVGKGEDWAGFKEKVNATDNPDKDLIIRVLEMYPNSSQEPQREAEIRNMAKTYRWLEDDILPQLRRSQMTLNYELQGKTDAELTALAKSNFDSLKVEEALFAATLSNDMAEKLRIYKECERAFPGDWRGANNVGFIYMEQNKLNDAAAQFEKAKNIEATPVVHNNLGIVARLRGDIAKAKDHYSQAAGAGNEVNYNKGIIEIKEGKYGQAVGNMGGFNTFNAALAQLLNGDSDAALRTIDGSDDKDSAYGNYLKAVIGAKTGNNELMINSLRAAVSKDGALKDKAKKDVVFDKYRTQSDFTGIVN